VNDATTTRARELRRDGSHAERICWELLRDRRMGGAKFRRQHPIGPYFADFACVACKLVVEIDGDHHAFQVDADARRTAAMAREGWRVLRFWASEVVANREGVAAEVTRVLAIPLTQPLPPRGEEPDLEEMPSHVPLPLRGRGWVRGPDGRCSGSI
jgi:very-short-patch-repair endonuclease